MSGIPHHAARLGQAEFDSLRDGVNEAAERLSEVQILELVDDLHEVLRVRRRLRGRLHHPVDDRLCGRFADVRL